MPRGIRKTRTDTVALLFAGQQGHGHKRPVTPEGTLWCTLGNHVVPISEVPTHYKKRKVYRSSCCYACKRDYDREAQRKSRAKTREGAMRRAAPAVRPTDSLLEMGAWDAPDQHCPRAAGESAAVSSQLPATAD